MQRKSKSGIIRTMKDKNHTFFIASNVPYNDSNLPWDCRGLLAYLMSKPDDWTIRVADLVKKGPAGQDRIYRMLQDLERHGYLTRECYRDEETGKFSWERRVYESPIPENYRTHKGQKAAELPDEKQAKSAESRASTEGCPSRGFPYTGEPDTGEPDTGEPDTENPELLVNTDVLKTDVPKTELPKTDPSPPHNVNVVSPEGAADREKAGGGEDENPSKDSSPLPTHPPADRDDTPTSAEKPRTATEDHSHLHHQLLQHHNRLRARKAESLGLTLTHGSLWLTSDDLTLIAKWHDEWALEPERIMAAMEERAEELSEPVRRWVAYDKAMLRARQEKYEEELENTDWNAFYQELVRKDKELGLIP